MNKTAPGELATIINKLIDMMEILNNRLLILENRQNPANHNKVPEDEPVFTCQRCNNTLNYGDGGEQGFCYYCFTLLTKGKE
jgi:hypothetical protein